MPELTIRTLDGGQTSLRAEELDVLAAALRGDIVPDGAPGYDDARHIWNAMIDRRPALVVRCRGAADVMKAVRFARDHALLVSVRGGGHNIGGNALADGAMLIDLSPMRSVRVDPRAHTARSEPGVVLGEFDRETQAFALATPLGINSTTGIAGLTLGGGYGWLSRRFGLTVDNLLEADVVTADGTLVEASEQQNGDLFWAIRGGGGNFGIVTSFEYNLHAVGPEVMAGLIVHPGADVAGLLRGYRDVMAGAPEELSAWVVLRRAPPLPFLPADVHGQEVLVIAVCYSGPMADGERVLRPLRAIGTPHADVVGPMPYVGFQAMFDPLLAPGARNYWKTHNFATLNDALVDAIVGQFRQLPGPQCEIFLANLGGAVGSRPDESTAYVGRSAQYVMNVHARWDDATADDGFIGWARATYAATAPWAAAGAYVNFMTRDEQDRVQSAYGQNYERLSAIKARYDPDNFFRVNQNITPAGSVSGARTAEGEMAPTAAARRA
jgi:FAD/FMN-containing dehydrogenase